MWIAVTATLPESYVKAVDQLRFELDRRLQRDAWPMASLVGPLQSHINTNRLMRHLAQVLHQAQPAKLAPAKKLRVDETRWGWRTALPFQFDRATEALHQQLVATALFGSPDHRPLDPALDLAFSEDETDVEDLPAAPPRLKPFYIQGLSLLVRDGDIPWEVYDAVE